MTELGKFCELLNYDPKTGVFTWKVRTKAFRGIRNPGDRAGSIMRGGYRRIGIDGVDYREHRLAWLFVHGRWPLRGLDHVNGNAGDNRICNLREATQSQNNANAKLFKNSSTGTRGVYPKRNKWMARIQFKGITYNLGCFMTKNEAIAAHMLAAKRIFQEFYRAPR